MTAMKEGTFKKIVHALFVDEKDENEKFSRAGMFALYRKELADQVQSWRFFIVLLIIAITGVISVYSAGQGIQTTAMGSTTANGSSTFLTLFSSEGSAPSFIWFLTFFGPLIGLILGFDAINGERSRRTLTRLVSQPIYRDSVINGKFLSGLTVIAIMVFSLGLIFVSMGIMLIGIPPSIDDILRIALFLVFTVVYSAIWLAVAILFSLLFRHSATAIMLGIAIWLFLTLFLSLIAQGVAGQLYPITDTSTVQDQMNYYNTLSGISRLSPATLYSESIKTILDPSIRSITPFTAAQADMAVVAPLPIDQSLLLVWPHLVVQLVIMFVCFIISYVTFMRQEIRVGS